MNMVYQIVSYLSWITCNIDYKGCPKYASGTFGLTLRCQTRSWVIQYILSFDINWRIKHGYYSHRQKGFRFFFQPITILVTVKET